jgi:nucleoside-diphosphate-sugar epimerase
MNKLLINDLDSITTDVGKVLMDIKNANIFITGGTGFIGKWLIESILFANEKLNLNAKISILSRNPKSFKVKFPFIACHNEITILQGDIRNFNFPNAQVDYIIHAATESSAKLNVENPLLMSDVIINGTRHLLDFAVKCSAKRVLFLSSGAVYGKQPEEIKGFKEDFWGAPDQLAIGSAYAESKRMAEFLCATYARQYNIGISVARCFAFVGPYFPLDTHFAIGNFINDGLLGRDIVITGNGAPLRSYMYASDMVVWLLTILLKGKTGEAYNVGSAKAISIKDLATTVAGFFPGIKVNILNQVRSTDRNQNYIPDISKSEKTLNLQLTVNIRDAIKKTILFHQLNRQKSILSLCWH